MTAPLPPSAAVVVIGGGIAGCATAYHLARAGCGDVLLLERRALTCGTTWHAAGLVGQLRATLTMTRIAQYTAGLLPLLEEETGQATGFRQNGSISIATGVERLEELKRGASSARAFGLEVDVIGPDEIAHLYPILNRDDVVGGVHLPKDGQTNPVDTTRALAAGARRYGARIIEGVTVHGVVVERVRVVAVETSAGRVATPAVVNAAGMWARALAAASGVALPLLACEDFYAVTEPVPGLPPDLPVLRDLDGRLYVKEEAGKLLFGCFEAKAKPWGLDGIPEDFAFDELPPDLDHFMPAVERALHRLPALKGVGMRSFFNGPESFTPDNRYHLGEAPGVAGYYVIAGFNSTGIQSSAGAAKLLAELILTGAPGMDIGDVDIRRAMPEQAALPYLAARVSESLGWLYDMHWPFRQAETMRGLRRSALHDVLAARGLPRRGRLRRQRRRHREPDLEGARGRGGDAPVGVVLEYPRALCDGEGWLLRQFELPAGLVLDARVPRGVGRGDTAEGRAFPGRRGYPRLGHRHRDRARVGAKTVAHREDSCAGGGEWTWHRVQGPREE